MLILPDRHVVVQTSMLLKMSLLDRRFKNYQAFVIPFQHHVILACPVHYSALLSNALQIVPHRLRHPQWVLLISKYRRDVTDHNDDEL